MQLIKKIKIARLKKNRDCVILSIGPIRSKSPFFYLRGSWLKACNPMAGGKHFRLMLTVKEVQALRFRSKWITKPKLYLILPRFSEV